MWPFNLLTSASSLVGQHAQILPGCVTLPSGVESCMLQLCFVFVLLFINRDELQTFDLNLPSWQTNRLKMSDNLVSKYVFLLLVNSQNNTKKKSQQFYGPNLTRGCQIRSIIHVHDHNLPTCL